MGAYRYRNRTITIGPAYYKQGVKFATLAAKTYKNYKKTTTGNRGTAGTGVSTQHDRINVYRRKRMPKWKRKRWASFVKKSHAANMKDVGSQTQIYNTAGTWSNGIGNQTYGAFHLYGKNGTSATADCGCKDISTVMSTALENGVNITNAAKVHFMSGVADLTLTNSGTVAEEVDIYHLRYRDEVDFTNFTNLHDASNANTDLISGSKPTLTLRGTTPFDLPLMLSSGKITILNKKKALVAAGGSTTYQIRDPRNWSCTRFAETDAAATAGFVQPYRTQTILVVRKPVAGAESTANSMSYGFTRKYLYKIESRSVASSGFSTVA